MTYINRIYFEIRYFSPQAALLKSNFTTTELLISLAPCQPVFKQFNWRSPHGVTSTSSGLSRIDSVNTKRAIIYKNAARSSGNSDWSLTTDSEFYNDCKNFFLIVVETENPDWTLTI